MTAYTHDTLTQLRTGQLKGIQRLDLSCGLTDFPREIFELADSLEVLNLSGNQLDSLPEDLPRLHRLRVIFCSNNRFTELPAVLGQCPQLQMVGFKSNRISHVPAAALPPRLRWLILTDNQLLTLPPDIGRCSDLQKLMLAGNQLQQLPGELANCQQLELLRISANQLTALPGWLTGMPRLSWLAYAGNPFSDVRAGPSASGTVQWQNLSLQNILGEGASGLIHQATLQTESGQSETVAIKLFKGAVTSDGWPHSELAACLAAGQHPHLIPVTAALAGHPEGTAGLVMELIPPHFTTLAEPPSLQSCTRDVYAANSCFSIEKIIRITHGVASVAAHLHARGLMHGDLYAHNLQCDADGQCLLGDMGAASFLPDDPAISKALQRLEVRAFGCLLEELLAHCDSPAPQALTTLRDSCLLSPAQRPLFESIIQQLATM
ncbi:MAG: leucine-rich repeat-containing protein kinase family protein [Pseudomonadota bacterium]